MPGLLESCAAVSPLAGLPAPSVLLTDIDRLERTYFERAPEPEDPSQMVAFTTAGHRGSPLLGSFTESHVLAITQAICDFRHCVQGTDGPLYMGKDTHALSGPAQRTALEVLAANGVETIIQQDNGVTPAPVISRAILAYNRTRKRGLADGIVVSPSHNPPQDGGIRYSAPTGGPPDADTAHWLETRANDLLREGNVDVHRVPVLAGLLAATTHHEDLVMPYVRDLVSVLDMDAIKAAHIGLAVDPLGGAALPYWEPIADLYGLDLTILNPVIDPSFAFMTVDHDGLIRMDCSSPFALTQLVALKDRYSLSFANDPDADSHAVVTPGAGLLPPNHYLAVSIQYLLAHRSHWHRRAGVGKTLLASSIIDRIVRKLGGRLCEVPPGFEWLAPGISDGSFSFGCDENAGATFLQHDDTAWTTGKDGLVMNLLAAEIAARTGRDPGELYSMVAAEVGPHWYSRTEAPAAPQQKTKLVRLGPAAVRQSHLAGQPILAKLNRAPGNNAPIGGLKVVAASGWFAAYPSNSENLYRIYAESFESQEHLDQIQGEAREIVNTALGTING
uniref:Phosphoglucomutase/phosphomannomutase alpha/beta/alpha domain I n=1 Tax=Solibacter usitatus (strain Ellin6076) TaxID=234267 RepID=Q023G7_SOLUE